MSTPCAEPALYGTGPGGEPVLYGLRCAACDRVSFPRQPYGCEACGSADGLPCELAATGTVRAAAEVHRHHDPRVPVPFTIVSVLLDDGPLIRGVHAGTARAGDRVRARLEPGGAVPDLLELRFATPASPAGPGGGA
ncbi:Zn-ribbon domain-containing OB-fold protein [Planomonospora venezuelensis]|uniref:Putative OB-fold protein n=1 Tax=Planomonospora venezuelensis TaxID=1999 RepID=A0A841DG97_PLAVE|nr:zinc ribbon domain-containing protein [Planomonospora venezuelensis]MBB5967115.1 putative OB-fold protein [Planomonospora venezuelensis]